MDDYGARWTDEKIAELEGRIASLYADAYDDVLEKYTAFCRRFERDDQKFSEQLKEGKITAATYRDWLRGQVFQRERWKKQLSDLAASLTRTNQAAMDIINEAAPGVFAMNANWAEFEIERAGNVDMGFGLYDEDTVKRLLRDEPDLLPPSRVEIPRDEAWNMKSITRQINLGILMGERLDDIAKRLQRVADMNENQARTHARTAMTGAQNAGRIEGYHRAQAMGIRLEKEWLATLDGYTRHAHAALDGQHVPVDAPFKSLLGNIMYPGDPKARPANVYNCRCTLISRLLDYPSRNAKRRPNLQEYGDALVQKPIRDMTYAEWARWKTAVPASPRFVNKMDDLHKNSQKIKPLERYEDVVVHGDMYGFAFKNADGEESNVSVREFAQILQGSPEYHGGAIRLISCETGAKDAIAAQALADELGVEVMAPSDVLFVWPDGEMTIGPDPLTNNGEWIIFKPRKRGGRGTP